MCKSDCINPGYADNYHIYGIINETYKNKFCSTFNDIFQGDVDTSNDTEFKDKMISVLRNMEDWRSQATSETQNLQDFECQICDKIFSSKKEINQHKKRIKHQKMKNKLKQDQEKRDVDILVGEMSSDFAMTQANISGDFTENMANSGVQFHCNICDVFCTDQEAFMNHMSAYHEENKPFATRLINKKGTVCTRIVSS